MSAAVSLEHEPQAEATPLLALTPELRAGGLVVRIYDPRRDATLVDVRSGVAFWRCGFVLPNWYAPEKIKASGHDSPTWTRSVTALEAVAFYREPREGWMQPTEGSMLARAKDYVPIDVDWSDLSPVLRVAFERLAAALEFPRLTGSADYAPEGGSIESQLQSLNRSYKVWNRSREGDAELAAEAERIAELVECAPPRPEPPPDAPPVVVLTDEEKARAGAIFDAMTRARGWRAADTVAEIFSTAFEQLLNPGKRAIVGRTGDVEIDARQAFERAAHHRKARRWRVMTDASTDRDPSRSFRIGGRAAAHEDADSYAAPERWSSGEPTRHDVASTWRKSTVQREL